VEKGEKKKVLQNSCRWDLGLLKDRPIKKGTKVKAKSILFPRRFGGGKDCLRERVENTNGRKEGREGRKKQRRYTNL